VTDMKLGSPEARARLNQLVEEFEQNPYPQEFKDFDWAKVAWYLGAELVAENQNQLVFQVQKGSVYMKHHAYGRIEIHDNGGELNLYAEMPVMTEEQSRILAELQDHNLVANRFFVWHHDVSSVPYTSTEGYVTNVALAYRIRMFIRQEPIDWNWLEKDPDAWPLYSPERGWKMELEGFNGPGE
jgi:hypothetical protein